MQPIWILTIKVHIIFLMDLQNIKPLSMWTSGSAVPTLLLICVPSETACVLDLLKSATAVSCSLRRTQLEEPLTMGINVLSYPPCTACYCCVTQPHCHCHSTPALLFWGPVSTSFFLTLWSTSSTTICAFMAELFWESLKMIINFFFPRMLFNACNYCTSQRHFIGNRLKYS